MEHQKTVSPYFLYVAIAFVAVLLVSNTVSSKIVLIGGLTFAGGIVIFPLSYIFGDILTEVYGYVASRRIIWSGFAAATFMSLCYLLVGTISPAPFWPNQAAYDAILGFVPRVVAGSLLAYFAGEFCNSYVLSRMKIWTQGRHLWTRTISSTLVGEGVDSVIFVLVAFAGVLPASALLQVIVSGYIVKCAVEVLFTPVTYYVVGKLKKLEGIDTYDYGVRYNPFALK